MQKNQNQKTKLVPLYELIWVFLSLLSLTSVLLLSFDLFSPIRALAISLSLLLASLIIFRYQIRVKDLRFTLIFLVILLVGLALRINPWIYLEGGQDEGVYVTMSKQYELSGGIEFKDNVTSLLRTPELEKYFKEANWHVLGMQRNSTNGNLYISFYPVHPLLMSITGFIFGENNRTWSLTLFSMLSITGVYLLTLSISKKPLAAYISSGIVATSVLHLYFSKFPVTEIIALAITMNTLYFIHKAYENKSWKYLVLATLLINMFMYLRLTWVIAIPFYILLVLILIAYEKNTQMKKVWSVWGVSLIISFLISTAFYYFKLNSLYIHFYLDIFKYIPEKLFYTLIIVLPIIFWAILKYAKKYILWILEKSYEYRVWLIYSFLSLMLLVTIWYFYKMAYTDFFVGSWFDYFWGMARSGLIVIKDMPLFSYFMYLTPFGVLGYLLSVKGVNSVQKYLLTFYMLLYFGFNIVISRYTPNHFYYARYQLSEAIPIIIILLSIYLSEIYRIKWLFYLIILPTLFYNLFYVAFLFQGPVGTTPEFFERVENTVEKRDIVIYYNPTGWSDSFLYTPLKYYYNQPSIKANSLVDVFDYAKRIKDYFINDVYILSTVPIQNSSVIEVDRIKYNKSFYAVLKEETPPLKYEINDWQIPFCKNIINEKFCSGVIPIKYHKGSLDIYLYNYK